MDKATEAQITHGFHQFVGFFGAGVAGAIFLLLFILTFISQCLMFKKAGYSGLLGCLLLVPCVGQFLIIWFGFANWPVLRKRRRAS